MEKGFLIQFQLLSVLLFYACFLDSTVPLSEYWKTIAVSLAPVTTPFFPPVFYLSRKDNPACLPGSRYTESALPR